ncbi:MAG TPA: phosphoribosylaminoimidazolesuccinocarboxamide synthase [Thermoplasmatales archaeon]|nr:MAG: phosphoribosylaminoimidazolesuccinocarboxamide synthase [Thermoplasmata archaeon]HDN50485.1 phosphoribosylaminoimidazolesuccinocarboxamide synthase [Thermoplasmatales archaeon]
MGSVKDLRIIEKPEKNKTGTGEFIFSDRYSVFDWGEMPDHFAHKGEALCIIGAYFFERLEEMGIMSHYIGVVEDDRAKRLDELEKASNTMRVRVLRVIKPEIRGDSYDYSPYKRERGNFLIPLEVIYRNSLPAGSSVFKRLREGSLKLEDIGLPEMPSPGQKLPKPILDVSTKLEITDRYIPWSEAQTMAGLSEDEVERMQHLTATVNDFITTQAKRAGLVNEDGKFEFGFDEHRNIMLVDVLGTPDECRFTREGIPVSKEVARIYYRTTEWYERVQEAKKRDRMKWKTLVDIPPPPLPPRLSELVSLLYQACCNELTEREWFAAPPLGEILSEVKEILELSGKQQQL